MTDLTALRALIEADTATRGQPVSKLGYFCAPFRPAAGPFSDRVIKVYRALPDAGQAARLAQAHDDYARVLRECGVPLPETAFHLLDYPQGQVPVIVQEALDPATLMRPQMIDADRAGALALMQAAGEVIATFWDRARAQPMRLGFHPSIRNFAVAEGRAIFFDTFPPLIHYSRDEMGRMLLQFSESRLMRSVGPLMRARVTGIQDEWYSPSETLVGLVGSACRLRPDDAAAFLDWGRSFGAERMDWVADEIAQGLDRPPKLPGYWTTFRKLMGLQGEPNV